MENQFAYGGMMVMNQRISLSTRTVYKMRFPARMNILMLVLLFMMLLPGIGASSVHAEAYGDDEQQVKLLYDSEDYTIGQRIPGTEDCQDMNSAYARELKQLTESRGFAHFDPLTYDYMTGRPVSDGICWAGLVGQNKEGYPYLLAVRWQQDGEGGNRYYINVYTWESGQMLFKGEITALEFCKLRIENVNELLVRYDEDSSDGTKFYARYYLTENEYIEAFSGRPEENDFDIVFNDEMDVLRGYIDDSDGSLQYVSAEIDTVYRKLIGEEQICPVSPDTASWRTMYQQIIDEYSAADPDNHVRYTLVCLDGDEIPELVLADYLSGTIRVFSSDGNIVNLAVLGSNTDLYAADRYGSFVLSHDRKWTGGTLFDIGMTISNGQITLRWSGCESEREGYGSFIWQGVYCLDLANYEMYKDKALSDLKLLWPQMEVTEIRTLIDYMTDTSSLSTRSGWDTETAYAFRTECGAVPGDTNQYEGDYEDYSDEDEYDEYEYDEYDDEYSDEEEESYTGPADLSDDEGDYEAVDNGHLNSGDPVTVPGDFYTDGQARTKQTGFILPQSGDRYLTEEDISHLTMKGICYVRNEIYARHGMKFNEAELQNYFTPLTWYSGYVSPGSFTESYMKSVLNEYEYANALFLQEYENKNEAYTPQ